MDKPEKQEKMDLWELFKDLNCYDKYNCLLCPETQFSTADYHFDQDPTYKDRHLKHFQEFKRQLLLALGLGDVIEKWNKRTEEMGDLGRQAELIKCSQDLTKLLE